MNVQVEAKLLQLLPQIRERETWTRQQLEVHQAGLLKELRTYSYTHSRFYQQFHKGLYDHPLQDLPVLTKDTMMENFDEVVTDPSVHLSEVEAHIARLASDECFQNKYWVNATSGSSGRRGVFLFNADEWATVVASYIRAYSVWTGLKEKGSPYKRAAVASITPWHQTARYAATTQNWRSTGLVIDSAEPVHAMVEKLNAWQPEALGFYPTTGRMLAEEQLSGRLHISPTVMISGGEVLTSDTRRRIEAAWGKNIFNHYGMTEAGAFSQECEKHCGLHVGEDMVIFEVVDRNNRPVAPGLYGDKLLITVLFNRTQPLIRYEISDLVRLAGAPCSCGRPYALIEDIQGRAEDILPFPGVDGGWITLHPIVLERIMEDVPCRGWQIIQDEHVLRVLLTGAQEGFEDNQLAHTIHQELERLGAVVPAIEVRRVSEIPRGTTAKVPLIKTTVKR